RLKGYNLAGLSEVAFNGMPSQFRALSNEEVEADVPLQATSGAVSVTVSNRVAIAPREMLVPAAGQTLGGARAAAGMAGSGSVLLRFQGLAGRPYDVQYATDLASQNWESLMGQTQVQTATNFSLLNGLAGQSVFFRAEEAPPEWGNWDFEFGLVGWHK